MTKLNLGCGRVIFPLSRDAIPYGDHLQPLEDACFEPGWTNVDRHALAGVDEVIDLFTFPWVRSSNGSPFNDDSVDLIWAAHIVEHIPHAVRPARMIPLGWRRQYDEWCEQMDGFFVFFAEAYRILKPGGLIVIRAPFAACYAALSDPTHTRYLTPGSFSYLQPQGQDAPFDYQLPMHFALLDESSVTYRLRGRWHAERNNLTNAGLMEALQTYNGVADEFRLTLRAVKGD